MQKSVIPRQPSQFLAVQGLSMRGTGWYLVVLGQYRSVLVDTWWFWVSMEWYWLIYDDTGSVEGGTCWSLVVMGQ